MPPRIILIYPTSMLTDPQVIKLMQQQGLRSPISIEHSIIDCERCNGPGWIGPHQLAAARNGLGEVVCYHCLTRDPQFGSMPMVALNPDIDGAPRRMP